MIQLTLISIVFHANLIKLNLIKWGFNVQIIMKNGSIKYYNLNRYLKCNVEEIYQKFWWSFKTEMILWQKGFN